MAGDAEVGGNGSVHWKVKHSAGTMATNGSSDASGKDQSGGGDITVEVFYKPGDPVPPITVKNDRVVITTPAYDGADYKKQVNINWKNK